LHEVTEETHTKPKPSHIANVPVGLLGYTITLVLAYTKIYNRSVETTFKPRQFGVQFTHTITLYDFASV